MSNIFLFVSACSQHIKINFPSPKTWLCVFWRKMEKARHSFSSFHEGTSYSLQHDERRCCFFLGSQRRCWASALGTHPALPCPSHWTRQQEVTGYSPCCPELLGFASSPLLITPWFITQCYSVFGCSDCPALSLAGCLCGCLAPGPCPRQRELWLLLLSFLRLS